MFYFRCNFMSKTMQFNRFLFLFDISKYFVGLTIFGQDRIHVTLSVRVRNDHRNFPSKTFLEP